MLWHLIVLDNPYLEYRGINMSSLSDIPFIGKLIDDYGEKLVLQGVEKLTGIDLSEKELTPEDKQKIMDSQIEIMKIDFDKLKLETEAKLEDKRLNIQNTNNAQVMNTQIQASEFSSKLAKNTAYIIDLVLVLSLVALVFCLFIFKLPIENKELAYTMFGSFLMYVGTVINFHRGSSKGSNEKQELINQFKGKL